MAALQDRELGMEGAGPTAQPMAHGDMGQLANAEAEQGGRGPVKLHSSSE